MGGVWLWTRTHCTRLEHASLDLNSLHNFKDWIAKSYHFKMALSHGG